MGNDRSGWAKGFLCGVIAMIVLGTGAWAAESGMASARISDEHLRQYSDLALTWMQDYLRVDTTNPPGNEMRAVEFFKKILDQEGIENRVFEYAPGRGDLWARLPRTTAASKRPIVLLNHMDVVTSDASHWKVPPFSGEIRDGYVWGRGAQDMAGSRKKIRMDANLRTTVECCRRVGRKDRGDNLEV